MLEKIKTGTQQQMILKTESAKISLSRFSGLEIISKMSHDPPMKQIQNPMYKPAIMLITANVFNKK